eukprot:jgi/Bigna1/75167/fgenesh1_pg.33_\
MSTVCARASRRGGCSNEKKTSSSRTHPYPSSADDPRFDAVEHDCVVVGEKEDGSSHSFSGMKVSGPVSERKRPETAAPHLENPGEGSENQWRIACLDWIANKGRGLLFVSALFIVVSGSFLFGVANLVAFPGVTSRTWPATAALLHALLFLIEFLIFPESIYTMAPGITTTPWITYWHASACGSIFFLKFVTEYAVTRSVSAWVWAYSWLFGLVVYLLICVVPTCTLVSKLGWGRGHILNKVFIWSIILGSTASMSLAVVFWPISRQVNNICVDIASAAGFTGFIYLAIFSKWLSSHKAAYILYTCLIAFSTRVLGTIVFNFTSYSGGVLLAGLSQIVFAKLLYSVSLFLFGEMLDNVDLPPEKRCAMLFMLQFGEDFSVSAIFSTIKLTGQFAAILLLVTAFASLRASGFLSEHWSRIVKGNTCPHKMMQYMDKAFRYQEQGMVSDCLACCAVAAVVMSEFLLADEVSPGRKRRFTRKIARKDDIIHDTIWVLLVMIVVQFIRCGICSIWLRQRLARLQKVHLNAMLGAADSGKRSVEMGSLRNLESRDAERPEEKEDKDDSKSQGNSVGDAASIANTHAKSPSVRTIFPKFPEQSNEGPRIETPPHFEGDERDVPERAPREIPSPETPKRGRELHVEGQRVSSIGGIPNKFRSNTISEVNITSMMSSEKGLGRHRHKRASLLARTSVANSSDQHWRENYILFLAAIASIITGVRYWQAEYSDGE